jgi:hypothetical protein
VAPTSGKAYDRRWWTLVVLSVSLLVISLDIEIALDRGQGHVQDRVARRCCS